ncbi:trehalose-phosphatase [Microbacterium marmarense]|uniref:Trehalose 6-phosphate phosphatase n=1 Tax=Microbacterium marmarense TaxID=3122051 RepID=A0ABU8LU14_9MICO
MSNYLNPVRKLATTDRLLVALDFDGTLSPLVDEPMQARMFPATRAAVNALIDAPETIVALVSGRSLVDLRVIAEHDDASQILLAGSHGAEYWYPDTGLVSHEDHADDARLRDELRAHAEAATAEVDGVWVEPKTFGFGLHTRLVDPAVAPEVQRRVDQLVAAQAPHWRRRTGHNITEYAFRHEGKDTAIAELREHVGATAVLFAGDDVTDEDALKTMGEGDLGIRVGTPPTAATVCVADIAELSTLLTVLSTERSAARQ